MKGRQESKRGREKLRETRVPISGDKNECFHFLSYIFLYLILALY